MPWKQVWEPSPSDLNMPVLTELPEGVNEQSNHWTSMVGLREANGRIDGEWVTFTHCNYCKGWIKGGAFESQVNTLDSRRLAGRQGTEYYCRRCGHELAFFGMVS